MILMEKLVLKWLMGMEKKGVIPVGIQKKFVALIIQVSQVAQKSVSNVVVNVLMMKVMARHVGIYQHALRHVKIGLVLTVHHQIMIMIEKMLLDNLLQMVQEYLQELV
jgi:hypothetical protein